MTWHHCIRFTHLALAAVLLLSLAACDTTAPVDEAGINANALVSEDLSALADSLTQDLNLSVTEAASLRATLARHDSTDHAPGFLWRIAAELQQTLDPDTKRQLFEILAELEARRLAQEQCLTLYHDLRASLRRRRHFDQRGPLACVYQVLVPEQLERVRAIRARIAEEIAALREALRAGEITEEEFRRQVQALKEAMEAEILGLLTEEQRAQVEACLQMLASDINPSDAFEAVFRAMVNVLDLSTEEVSALNELHERHHAAVQMLRRQFRNGEIDEATYLEEIRALCRAYNEALATILDDVQLEIVDLHRLLVYRLVPSYLWMDEAGERGRE